MLAAVSSILKLSNCSLDTLDALKCAPLSGLTRLKLALLVLVCTLAPDLLEYASEEWPGVFNKAAMIASDLVFKSVTMGSVENSSSDRRINKTLGPV